MLLRGNPDSNILIIMKENSYVDFFCLNKYGCLIWCNWFERCIWFTDIIVLVLAKIKKKILNKKI